MRPEYFSKNLRVLLLVVGSSLLPWVVRGEIRTGVLLPDGKEFISWEEPLRFSKTYYVNQRHPKASDSNPGTQELPFLTISRAASLLQAGERVMIASGIYRGRVDPARGGTGPLQMISYEAAPGATVIVRGSHLVKQGWQPSTGYPLPAGSLAPKVYQLNLEPIEFHGYNPFAMVNLMGDRRYLAAKPEELRPHLLRRGMVFCDGHKLEQAELFQELGKKAGRFWVEHQGTILHARLPGDANPAEHEVELVTEEQVFAPHQRGLAYIRVKGITFEQAANGFPVPQHGLVSASGGHHWIIEDCVLRHANSVALDLGYQDWNAIPPSIIGHSIVRRNHIEDAGVCGVAGLGVQDTLIESNLIENVGWQDVEFMWESGGIKLHATKNCLLRNNVIRHLRYAPGVWLDYENHNTRVTGNIFGDLQETLRGGIYLEASQYPNLLDHNIFWNITRGKGGSLHNIPPEGGCGIITDGSDDATIAHNLFGQCENAGVQTRTTENRIVGNRGGTARDHRVLNNIFYRCGKSIHFSHKENMAEGNLYLRPGTEDIPEYQSEGRGLNWIAELKTTLYLDLPAWQKYFGFDRRGAYADMEIAVDLDELKLSWKIAGSVPAEKTAEWFQHDLLGRVAGESRPAGPLAQALAELKSISIDPRQ
jgi:hypothetical protein